MATATLVSRNQCYQLTVCILVLFVVYILLWLVPFSAHLQTVALPKPAAPLATTTPYAGAPSPTPQARADAALERMRRAVAAQLAAYPFQQDQEAGNFLIDRGGRPVRALVASTWRSGSTFLGDILGAHPATFYHYEPLLHYGIQQIRRGETGSPDALKAKEAVRTLKQLFNCDYSNLENYLTHGRKHLEVFSHNKPLYKRCNFVRSDFCWDPSFLSSVCKMFPFQSMKMVRLRLNLTRELLEDKNLDLRVLLLVRDPRGTLQSRQHRDWCAGNSDCDNPDRLCSDLVEDYRAAKQLLKAFPDRVRVLRYEDLSSRPESLAADLLPFFGFQLLPDIKHFLSTHTRDDQGGVTSTFRNSQLAPYHWKTDLPFTQIERIQAACKEAMKVWGYRTYRDENEMDQLDSVLDYYI